MRWASERLALALSVAIVSAHVEVRAQDEPAHTEEAKESARRFVEDAYRKQDAGDRVGALASFVSAHQIMRVPTTGLLVAKAHLALGQLVEARLVLQEVAAHPVTPDEPAAFTRDRKKATEMRDAVAKRIPSIAVQVKNHAGATVEITVDGELTTGSREVNPGKHTVVVHLDGELYEERVIDVAEGALQVVEVGESADEAAVEAPEGDSVFVPLTYVGFGIAGLGLTLGAITGAISLSEASAAEDLCTANSCLREADPHIDRSIALGHTSTVSFVVAGAGAALGLISLLLIPESEDTGSTVRATIGPAALSVTISSSSF